MFENLRPIDKSEIHQIEFPIDNYFTEEFQKKQIVLHHTVSGPSINGDVTTWINDKIKVGTFAIIDRDGVCHQLFGSKYWCHHLGLKQAYLKDLGISDYITRNDDLDKRSIGIELDNWGWLERKNNSYYTCYDSITNADVTYYQNGYRDHSYYESYSIPQLNTLGSLLLYLNSRYNIPLRFNKSMFDVSLNAIRGDAGIWTHTSYRNDKTDCHPDPNLIDLLNKISS